MAHHEDPDRLSVNAIEKVIGKPGEIDAAQVPLDRMKASGAFDRQGDVGHELVKEGVA